MLQTHTHTPYTTHRSIYTVTTTTQAIASDYYWY
jgi:hypothetical protein